VQKRRILALRDWGILGCQRDSGERRSLSSCALNAATSACPTTSFRSCALEPRADAPAPSLAKTPSLLRDECPSAAVRPLPRTDTMDTFVYSSCTTCAKRARDSKTMGTERAQYWMPADNVQCVGSRTAILNLLYGSLYQAIRARAPQLDSPAQPAHSGMVLNLSSRAAPTRAPSNTSFSPDASRT